MQLSSSIYLLLVGWTTAAAVSVGSLEANYGQSLANPLTRRAPAADCHGSVMCQSMMPVKWCDMVANDVLIRNDDQNYG
jgi:hypothetical protein